jgi:hypothetical protein
MQEALNQAGRAFESSEEPEIRALLPRISDYQARMEPLAYDCIGCKKCWGADATIENRLWQLRVAVTPKILVLKRSF